MSQRKNAWGGFEIMIMSWYFYSSLHFEYSSLFSQKTAEASGIPFAVYVFFAVSSCRLSLSFIHFEIMQDNISIFFFSPFLKYKTLLLHFLSSLCVSLLVPGDTSPRMAALICRKTSWEYWFSKSALFSLWKKKKGEEEEGGKKLSAMRKPVAFN